MWISRKRPEWCSSSAPFYGTDIQSSQHSDISLLLTSVSCCPLTLDRKVGYPPGSSPRWLGCSSARNRGLRRAPPSAREATDSSLPDHQNGDSGHRESYLRLLVP